MTTPDRRPVTNSLKATLERATSLPVGKGEAPAHEENEPYLVLHSLNGGELSGPPLAAPDADATFPYQIDAVGKTHDQAEWAGDLVRRTMLARNADGSFQVVMDPWGATKEIQREMSGSPSGVAKGGTKDFPVYSVQDRYNIYVTPT